MFSWLVKVIFPFLIRIIYLIVLGGYNYDGKDVFIDDILVLNKKTLLWQSKTKMQFPRYAHAVSVVNLEDVKPSCS